MEGTHADVILTDDVRQQKEFTFVTYKNKKASQVNRVYSVLIDHYTPLTLAEISKLTGIKSETSIASRIRDIREGGYVVNRSTAPTTRKGSRVFAYVMA